jgi:hypothetical protein
MSANKRLRRIAQVPADEREEQPPRSDPVQPEQAVESSNRLDLRNFPELLAKLVESSPYQDAVEYWFRKLEGHTIFEYPANKVLDLDEYMWKYHHLPPGARHTKTQFRQYVEYLAARSNESYRMWEPLFVYLAAHHGLSEAEVRAMSLREVAALLQQDYSNRRPESGEKGDEYPLGIILLPDSREAKRDRHTVAFGGRNIAWKMLVTLCRQYPAYIPPADLGHAACNEGWLGDDPGLDTLYNHILELNRIVKPLGVRAKHIRRTGYRLEQRTS